MFYLEFTSSRIRPWPPTQRSLQGPMTESPATLKMPSSFGEALLTMWKQAQALLEIRASQTLTTLASLKWQMPGWDFSIKASPRVLRMYPESFSTAIFSIVRCLGVRLVRTRGPGEKGPSQLPLITLQILQVAAGHQTELLRTKLVN